MHILRICFPDGSDQLCGYCEGDLYFCFYFRICKMLVCILMLRLGCLTTFIPVFSKERIIGVQILPVFCHDCFHFVIGILNCQNPISDLEKTVLIPILSENSSSLNLICLFFKVQCNLNITLCLGSMDTNCVISETML